MLLKENAIRKERIIKGKNRYYIHVFKCATCGKEINVQGGCLKTHTGKCRRCTQLKEPYRYIYNELKTHRKKDVDFTITFNEFLEKIKISKCHYCGKQIKYHENSRYWGDINSRAHQLDRKDNSVGYTNENTVCCCWICNRLKSNIFTYDEFMMLSPTLKQIEMNRERNRDTYRDIVS